MNGMRSYLPDLPDVDWSNPDVQQVLDMFGWKYEQKCKETAKLVKDNAEKDKRIAEQDKRIAEQDKRIAEQDKRIAELESLVKTQQAGGTKSAETAEPDCNTHDGPHGRKKSRKYNTRKFKDYPKIERSPRTVEYAKYDNGLDFKAATMHTENKTADILACPVYGTPLSEKIVETYNRTTEDAVIGGGWCMTHWVINRRYCKKCRKSHTAQPEGVLPNEHYGVNIMAIVAILRNLIISFESIQKIILMTYGRFIHISTLESMNNTVADMCRPLYDAFMNSIKDSEAISGDHTGWFLNGKTFYALIIIGEDITLYHFTPIKAGMVAEAILQDFDGIILSDSDSSWNSMGELWQKCLLHYFRNIERTLDDIQESNEDGEEYKVFAHELKLILKRAIKLGKIHKDKNVPEKYIQNLEKRIERLINGEYTDTHCIRFVKRLKRESTHLFTFLRYDIEFHNNTSERGLRPIARMRQFLFGNRSERGLKTTETMATIYATCEMRRINPYHFLVDYLSGRINSIPKPPDLSCKKDTVEAVIPATA